MLKKRESKMEAITEKTLDKTVLRDFAVNARKKLKERIELQANLMGFYEDNRQVNYEFEDDKFFKINGETFSKKQAQKLREQITKKTFATVIDEVAYTWFNRFIALYYMEVNGYSENNCNIISNLSNISQYAVSIASLLSDEEKQSIIENINNIGLVGYWDNIAFDEFAGSSKKVDKALVDIMKGYMANQSFSRGVETLNAEASMTFIGNTKHNVPYMLKHSNLFEELPPQYLDSAFLDRLHFYIPGWEIDVIRNELFSNGYGFVVDYYAEALKALRNFDYSNEYKQALELSSDISTRDRDGIRKTFSGLMKIIFPHKKATNEEIEELLKFAMEGRKRVKDQILRIDSTLPAVDFSYTKNSGEKVEVKTLEEIQYKNLYNPNSSTLQEVSDVQQAPAVETQPIIFKEEKKELKEQHIIIEENQTGITYEELFGDYIKGASQITITDAYIRNFYQTLNLMEFLEVVEKLKSDEDEVKIELITGRDEYLDSQQEENLATIRESCFQMGIDFSYSFDSTIHARSLVMDNGWKILLDRGLDIYQNCERKDAFQFTTRVQKYRPCKRTEITYIKQ